MAIDELPLRVEDLTIVDAHDRLIVADISFAVGRGETFGIAGQSGSGKTTLSLGLLAYTRRGARIRQGRVLVGDADILSTTKREVRSTRAHGIAYVPQDARSALTPTMRVGALLNEALRAVPRDLKAPRLQDSLAGVGLDSVDDLLKRFPHQLSGGQLQRVAIAMAIVHAPRVLVLDEPTSSLDEATRDGLLTAVDRLRDATGMAVVLVSHDLDAIRSHASAAAVMESGRFTWRGVPELVGNQVTVVSEREVQRARTIPEAHRGPISTDELLVVRNLTATYAGRSTSAIEHVSFEIAKGECLAVTGPSGCGKTTIARCVAGLHKQFSGSITLSDSRGPHALPAAARERSIEDRRRIQIVFQNPYSSLNPAHTVGYSINRALISLARSDSHRSGSAKIGELLEQVGLPASYASLYPRQLSGGERQRIAIARAIAPRPELLICDEITSALDVTTQDTILTLLESLRAEMNLALLLITHDVSVALRLADRVLQLPVRE